MYALAGLILVLALPSAPAPGFGQSRDAPEIALYTMGPGPNVWERYGHAALSVRMPGEDEAVCFNYGTMDFRSPVGLFWGILRAEPVFWVSFQPCLPFISSYMAAGRDIYRQPIPLPPDEARKLALALAVNAEPENSHYIYHHFYDNCATRLRDHLNRALHGALEKPGDTPLGPSFRDFGRQGVADMNTLLYAMDVFLGRGSDYRPNQFEAAYLPDHLRELVTARIGVRPDVINGGERLKLPPPPAPWKWWSLVVLLFNIPALISWVTGKKSRLGAGLSLVVPILSGLVLWFLFAVSAVPQLRWNDLLLVFVPLDGVALFLGETIRKRYAQARLVILALVLVAGLAGILQQPVVGPVCLVALPWASLLWPLRRYAK